MTTTASERSRERITGTFGGAIGSIFGAAEALCHLLGDGVHGTAGFVEAYANVGDTMEQKSLLWKTEEKKRVTEAMKKLK